MLLVSDFKKERRPPPPRNIAPDLENASCIRFQGERRPPLCVGVWRGPLCCLLLPEPHFSAVICCSVLCSAVHLLLFWCYHCIGQNNIGPPCYAALSFVLCVVVFVHKYTLGRNHTALLCYRSEVSLTLTP